jgi:glucosamine--fructose-6-phosphate aminotransferase (isomerizing)
MTYMKAEALQSPDIIASQWIENISTIKAIAKKINANPPLFAVTIARGSSDHAANFLKYLFEKELGIVTASLPPSLSSIYKVSPNMKNALAVAISQSGASPDICSSLEDAKKSGALTIAITNIPNSRLANIADFVLPLHAGIEKSVAATKTYLASLAVIIQLIAILKSDKSLLRLLPNFPEALTSATHINWDLFNDIIINAENLIVIGRGVSYPIAQEAALKFKETCHLHAEPFSAAEFQHGPMALVKKDFPILFFAQHDEALSGLLETSKKLTSMGANTFLAIAENDNISTEIAKHRLSLPPSLHPLLDPLMIIQAFYIAIEKLSRSRGFDPDNPRNLKKITETY